MVTLMSEGTTHSTLQHKHPWNETCMLQSQAWSCHAHLPDHTPLRYRMSMRPRSMGASLAKVSAWRSSWSDWHSGQASVIMMTVDLELGSVLHRPCAEPSTQCNLTHVKVHACWHSVLALTRLQGGMRQAQPSK